MDGIIEEEAEAKEETEEEEAEAVSDDATEEVA